MKVFTLICFQCNYRTHVHWFYWEWNDSYHKNQIKGVDFWSIKINISYGRSRCSPVSARRHSSHKTDVRGFEWVWHYCTSSTLVQTSRCHWHWFQTNWTYHFSPRYFNGIKIVTAFKCIFEETMSKLSVNFGIKSHKTLIRTNIPAPSVISVFCTTIQWQMLIKFAAEVPYLSHVTVSPVQSSDSCSVWFVWN